MLNFIRQPSGPGSRIGRARQIWSDEGMANKTRHRGRWTTDDRIGSAWHCLPVEVPAGARGLRVALEYDRSAAVLDLGCAGPVGFRGWSGSARRSFVITTDAATPGYLSGELEPGTWQVLIGIHRLPAEGVAYRLEAEVSTRTGELQPEPVPAPPPPLPPGDRPPARVLPARPGRRWLAGDLHTHTVHSDGAQTVPELARFAAGLGLDYIAVTDHNTVSHHRELPAAAARYGITLVPGQEVTTPGGHAGALGEVGWVDFRLPADSWLEQTRRRGGLLSVNHPIGGHVSWTLPMRGRPPLVEVWHWSWLDPRWTAPLAWWLAWDPGAIPVGGSDWHRPGAGAPPGTPTTWVECAGDGPDAVLDGLRCGRVTISGRRDGPVLLRSSDGLIAVDAEGTTLAGPDGPLARVRSAHESFPVAVGYHRLLDDTGATLALAH
jgi:hypothetical protein